MTTAIRPTRIAMWSGPRNISTAMMRSWGSRPDTFVVDEPFYAHYLQSTKNDYHPGYEETLAAHENDWRRVVDQLTGPIPQGKAIFYQKQMAHHLVSSPGASSIDLGWTETLTNCLLIRDPREMLTSLIEFFPNPDAAATGLPQQVALYERLADRTGGVPPIIDAKDVLSDPAGMLRRLCEAIDVPFRDEMLSWGPGPRATDGVWGPHFYAKVYETTSFGKYRPKEQDVPEHLLTVLAECDELYAQLHPKRLRVEFDHRN